MKLLSWNVNGIRAVLQKNFLEFLSTENPHIIGLQETKGHFDQLIKKDQEALQNLGYHIYWNGAQRPGYSGTAVLSKTEALSVQYGIDRDSFDFKSVDFVDETLLENHEWRVTTIELKDYYFVTVYTPNAKDDLSRLSYRYGVWDKAFLQYLKWLENKKPVIVCWDFNVAHKEIDLARPKDNTMSAGFTKEEREWMDNFIASGFIDTFRYFYPERKDRYSWWSYRAGARARNVGWRIDYFLTSNSFKENLKDAFILDQVNWSDHCPVGIELK
jgi:exodeoxyribonuclease III